MATTKLTAEEKKTKKAFADLRTMVQAFAASTGGGVWNTLTGCIYFVPKDGIDISTLPQHPNFKITLDTKDQQAIIQYSFKK